MVAGALYNLGALIYAYGYRTGGAGKRNGGLAVVKYVGLLTTVVTSIMFAVELI
jgi:hypothetical protein